MSFWFPPKIHHLCLHLGFGGSSHPIPLCPLCLEITSFALARALMWVLRMLQRSAPGTRGSYYQSWVLLLNSGFPHIEGCTWNLM